jgi:type IV pilus assembly protein PilQ
VIQIGRLARNNSMNSTLQKIPGIGDIPILGHLFKNTTKVNNKNELLIFVTPKILREGVKVN